MPSRIAVASRLLLALLLLNLAACTTMQPVRIPDEQQPRTEVRIGNHVEIVTREGHEARFEVTRLDEQGLGGAHEYYLFEELTSLKVQRQAAGRWDWLGWVALAGLLIFAFSESDSTTVNAGFP